MFGEPDEDGWRKEANRADSADTKSEHECQGFHNVAFALAIFIQVILRVSKRRRTHKDEALIGGAVGFE